VTIYIHLRTIVHNKTKQSR